MNEEIFDKLNDSIVEKIKQILKKLSNHLNTGNEGDRHNLDILM